MNQKKDAYLSVVPAVYTPSQFQKHPLTPDGDPPSLPAYEKGVNEKGGVVVVHVKKDQPPKNKVCYGFCVTGGLSILGVSMAYRDVIFHALNNFGKELTTIFRHIMDHLSQANDLDEVLYVVAFLNLLLVVGACCAACALGRRASSAPVETV